MDILYDFAMHLISMISGIFGLRCESSAFTLLSHSADDAKIRPAGCGKVLERHDITQRSNKKRKPKSQKMHKTDERL